MLVAKNKTFIGGYKSEKIILFEGYDDYFEYFWGHRAVEIQINP